MDKLNAFASRFFDLTPFNIRRSITPRVIISLLAVWTASSMFRTGAYTSIQLTPIGHQVEPGNVYGHSPQKLAILFEPRQVPHLATLLLHTGNVLPKDWPLLYIGTKRSISRVNESYAIQSAQERGMLRMQEAPDWINFEDEDVLKNIFGMPEFYDALPKSVEWLFVTGSDSILCSQSYITMNDWLQYDWVGSPWASNSWQGGTNGFSLRRVSKVRKALRKIRRSDNVIDDSHIMEAVLSAPSAKLPAEKGETFVMESAWSERPMAYHPAQRLLAEEEGWSQKHLRTGIFEHCSEVKVIMEMKLNREKCPDPPQVPTPNERKAKQKAEDNRLQAELDKKVAEDERKKAEEARKWAQDEERKERQKTQEEAQKKLQDEMRVANAQEKGNDKDEAERAKADAKKNSHAAEVHKDQQKDGGAKKDGEKAGHDKEAENNAKRPVDEKGDKGEKHVEGSGPAHDDKKSDPHDTTVGDKAKHDQDTAAKEKSGTGVADAKADSKKHDDAERGAAKDDPTKDGSRHGNGKSHQYLHDAKKKGSSGSDKSIKVGEKSFEDDEEDTGAFVPAKAEQDEDEGMETAKGQAKEKGQGHEIVHDEYR